MSNAIIDEKIYSELSNSTLGVYGENDDSRLVVDIETDDGDYTLIDMDYQQAIKLKQLVEQWINAKSRTM